MTDDNDPLILGGELAAADHIAAGPSPLAEVSYPAAATELWRWTETPQDSQIASFLSENRGEARDRLTMDDFYTLITFARRSALAALRTRNPDHVSAAYDALAMIDLDRIDWRDASWAAAIVTYAAQRLNLDLEAAIAGPASRASEDTADMLAEAIADEVDLSADWGYAEIQTDEGTVLLSTEDEPYAPEADLASLGLELALALDADAYDVDGVTLAGELYPTWVADQEHLVTNLPGVVSVHGDHRAAPQNTLLAFLGEARTPDQAQAIADAAQAHNDVACTAASGKLFAVMIARSVIYGEQGIESSLTRFTPALEALLRQSQSRKSPSA
ncbi:hypothetical protein ACIBG8_29370 [Nonomuraea sp. NPDC050556]|uniref:hypothetical protein n=1 Tax=Nonomuraea sp. NPDC050556 TaxID=3364369 RepID=UPI00378B83F2